MAINFFGAFADSVSHCAGISASFFVLAAFAVLIDWGLRWCEDKGTTRALLHILHAISLAIVAIDGVLVVLEAAYDILMYVKPLIA